MLLFIHIHFLQYTAESLISIHLMLLFILIPWNSAIPFCYFNTSHVTVYQKADEEEAAEDEFQYISCYCLSLPPQYL